jgi:radical SAM protein with 4Fe4S-binding SPASM domain
MWGEPFIHKDVFRMIRYATDQDLAVQISSNLNVFRDGFAHKIVDSGLEHLIVAMDGVSQEVYEKYRVGGKIERVIRNLELILQARAERRSRFPEIELQYIVFPHNRHELEAAENLAFSLGVDRFTVIDTVSNTDKTNAKLSNGAPRNPDKCNSLWMLACFNWDGSLSPCCDSVDDSFGNLVTTDLASLWNSEKLQRSRSLHTSKPRTVGPETKCSRCRIYGSYVTFLPEDSCSSSIGVSV